MKKKVNNFRKFSAPVILIIIFGLVYLLPFYRNEFYVSHDGESIVVKTASLYRAVIEGQNPPRWAGDMNYKYGAPVLNFYYPLGSYFGALAYFLGVSLELSFMFLIGLAFVLSGSSFYLYASTFLTKRAAFGAALLYMLAPYHFLNTFVRGQLGEMLAFVFVPLVFYSLDSYSKNKLTRHIIIGGVSFALLIVSHNILALLFSIIIGLYVLVSSSNIKLIINKFIILLLGLGLSAYFWAPALYEGKYINSKLFVGNYFADHFIRIENLIYAPWGFGPNINDVGGLAPQIGIIQIILVLLSLLLLRFKKYRVQIAFWLGIFIVSIFFTNERSSFLWGRLHILEQFQFPWRFIAIASFAAAVLAGYVLNYTKKNILNYLVIVIVLILSVRYVQVSGFEKKPDSFYLNYPGTGAYHGESTTIWTEGDAGSYPAFPLEIIAGKGEISNYKRKSNLHEFYVNAENDLVIRDNTTYYPGWRVFVSGKESDIQFQDPNHRGIITFPVPKGEHIVEVKFGETAFRLAADIISFLTFALLLILFLFRKKFDKLIRKI